MADKKNIILTFDYELFLGSRSGTVENCLLIPTQKLIELLSTYSIKHAIFFVDTTYLIRLKNNNTSESKKDYENITKQLTVLHQQGHYIYPHLHPHWLDAHYISEVNQWDLSNTSKYSFSAINEQERESLFKESIEILEEIVGPQKDYGYRAGGWCIEPFQDFKPYFKKHNIKYDFSVMHGYTCISDFQNFDFSVVPEKSNYSFEDKTTVEDLKGEFIEFPISKVKISRINRILNKFFIKILYRKGITNFGDGFSTNSAALKEINPVGHEMASVELLTITNLEDYLKGLQTHSTLHLISHPKMLNLHNLTCLEVLFKKAFARYDINTDFKKI